MEPDGPRHFRMRRRSLARNPIALSIVSRKTSVGLNRTALLFLLLLSEPKIVLIKVKVFVGLLKVIKVDLVPQQTTDTAKTPDKLRALLASVCDKLQRRSKLLVIVREPVDVLHLLAHFELDAVVQKALRVLRLSLGHNNHALDACLWIHKLVSQVFEVLPNDEHLNGTELERSQCVVDSKAVAVRVLGNLVKVARDKLFLLNELDVAQGLSGQVNGLIEAVLATVRDVHDFDHLGP
mmetsp:Transcript_5450/g.14642  ORF Transcript_5450/g.14642 Transcript_5450/m.14642 type:complete len:237 (-) Transcript_5450:745-1455(-)